MWKNTPFMRLLLENLRCLGANQRYKRTQWWPSVSCVLLDSNSFGHYMCPLGNPVLQPHPARRWTLHLPRGELGIDTRSGQMLIGSGGPCRGQKGALCNMSNTRRKYLSSFQSLHSYLEAYVWSRNRHFWDIIRKDKETHHHTEPVRGVSQCTALTSDNCSVCRWSKQPAWEGFASKSEKCALCQWDVCVHYIIIYSIACFINFATKTNPLGLIIPLTTICL